MILYSIGCSHTYGHCLENKELVWSNLIMKSLINDYMSYGTGFKQLTSQSIQNVDNIFVNESICGAGNDYIFHKSLESISLLIDENKKPDYVMVQWSGPNRRQHCTPNRNIVYVNLHDNVEHGVKFEPMGSEHTLHYMFSLQEFLKKENINYIFFNYMGLESSIKNLSIFKKIDFTNIINFGFGDQLMFGGLLEQIKKMGFNCDEQGHPNENGNYYIANEISKKLGLTLVD